MRITATLATLLILIPVVSALSCNQQPGGSGQASGTGAASGGTRGTWWAPLGNAGRDCYFAGTGIDDPAMLFRHYIPAPAEFPQYAASAPVCDGDDTCYVLATAIPGSKKIKHEKQLLKAAGSDVNLEELLLRSLSDGEGYFTEALRDALSPKQAWLYALASDGKCKWIYKADGAVQAGPIVTRNGDILFATHNIYCQHPNLDNIELEDLENLADWPTETQAGIYLVNQRGKLIRKLDTGSSLAQLAITKNDMVIALTYHDPEPDEEILVASRLVAMNLDGDELWAKQLETAHQRLACATDQICLAVENRDPAPDSSAIIHSEIYSLDAATGERVWTFDCETDGIWGLICSDSGNIYGALETDIYGNGYDNNLPLSQRLKLHNTRGRLVCLDHTGKLQWQAFTIAGTLGRLAAGADGTVYAVCEEYRAAEPPMFGEYSSFADMETTRYLQAFSATGVRTWRYDLSSEQRGVTILEDTCLSVDEAGNVYLVAANDALNTVYPATLVSLFPGGSERWAYYLRGYADSLGFRNDGAVVVTVLDHVYCLGQR